MPRRPRLDLAYVPQHVVQRGHDRQACFFDNGYFERYLTDLREISMREGCAVHAYVLMTNHVHLLITPSATGQIGRVMQALGRRYVRHVNDRRHRSGTLWEGRYKACLVDTDQYLLRCYRYIELNPVRAAIVRRPEDYPWSSCRCNAHGEPDPLVHPHAIYRALGADDAGRQSAYRSLIDQALPEADLDAIRRHLQKQHAFGAARFRAAVEAQLRRRAGPGRNGRPPKNSC